VAKRVLLYDLHPLTRELVEGALAGAPDIVVVGHIESAESLPDAAAATRADVVLTHSGAAGVPDPCAKFLAERAHVRVIVIGHGQHESALIELREHRTELDDLGRDGLAMAILGAAS
jgi:DNA-binding NarL/FixJ family response regulator